MLQQSVHSGPVVPTVMGELGRVLVSITGSLGFGHWMQSDLQRSKVTQHETFSLQISCLK